MTIIITRSQNYPKPARPGFAWHWLYATNTDISGFTNLKSLEKRLRTKYPGCTIVYSWK